ncbi:MAG TPA: hypothetical protein VFF06_09775 [Polyangia bacterium]|nr:hypothetical protein [Polyangia bacterium]
MGFFSKLFGGKSAEGAATDAAREPEPEPQNDPQPDAVVVLRRGMSVPKPDYLARVIAAAFPGGLDESVPRVGLSQPSWYKTEEVADQIAAGVTETFALKFALAGATSRRRALDGPDGCQVMLVELYRS